MRGNHSFKTLQLTGAKLKNKKNKVVVFPTKLILFLVVIFVLVGVTLHYLFPGKQGKRYLPQDYIFARADILKKLIYVRDSAKTLLSFQLLYPYIDEDLRPAQDKFHSILKQTRIYEDMYSKDHEAAPPENFISASLSALGEIESQHLSTFLYPVRKCYRVLVDPLTHDQVEEHGRKLKELVQVWNEFYNLATFIQKFHRHSERFYNWIPFGIRFSSENDSEDKESSLSISAEEVERKLRSVAEDLVELTSAQNRASSRWFRPTNELAETQDRIASKVAMEGHYYKLTQHYHIQLQDEAHSLLTEVVKEKERKESMYLHLGKILIEQVKSLKSRIKKIGKRV